LDFDDDDDDIGFDDTFGTTQPLNTEVPRMDYQVMISDEVVLTETFDIQKHFSDYPVDDFTK
jgi:hypothetical protein